MRKTLLLLVTLMVLGLVSTVPAADYKLTNGQTVSGELVESGSNDAQALINLGNSKYERVNWSLFSQDDLKGFLEKFSANKKVTEAVSANIEVSVVERVKKTEVTIKPVSPIVDEIQKGRTAPKATVIGSLFKSAPGLLLAFLVLAANIFAGYEIAIFRAQPVLLVAGLAAIPGIGLISNIIFLAMPTRMEKKSEQDIVYEANEATAQTFTVPGQDVEAQEAAAAAEHASEAAPKAEVYSRGQFTFNKRFFETKFPNFFGVVRREEDKAKLLVFKTTKGQFNVSRITRISAGEIYIQADRGGGASVEEAIHFAEIQEVSLSHVA